MSYEDQLNQMAELQKQQAMNSLAAQRDSSITALNAEKDNTLNSLKNSYNQNSSTLNAEKAQIEPKYYGLRNQASTASQLQAKNFAEFMANRGLSSSGTAAQAELLNNNALQNNIGSYNTQEQGAYNDNARRMSDLTTAYNNNVNTENSTIANKISAANNQYNQNLAAQYASIQADLVKTVAAYRLQQEQQAAAQRAAAAKAQQTAAKKAAQQQQQNSTNYQNLIQKMIDARNGEYRDSNGKVNSNITLGQVAQAAMQSGAISPGDPLAMGGAIYRQIIHNPNGY